MNSFVYSLTAEAVCVENTQARFLEIVDSLVSCEIIPEIMLCMVQSKIKGWEALDLLLTAAARLFRIKKKTVRNRN